MIQQPYRSNTLIIRQESNTDASYHNYYEAVEEKRFMVSNELSISILDELSDTVISCLIQADGGATAVSPEQVIIENDIIFLCCGRNIFAVTLPNLLLLWKLKADEITCFRIFNIEEDLLVHGEMEVSRISKSGNIIWQFGGRDIFVSIEGTDECVILPSHIELTDFDGYKYSLSYDGVEL